MMVRMVPMPSGLIKKNSPPTRVQATLERTADHADQNRLTPGTVRMVRMVRGPQRCSRGRLRLSRLSNLK
jgi:hypothetical protein